MHVSRFSRLLWVACIAGLFYVGHGLHTQSASTLPGTVSKAVAGERIRGEHYSIEPPAPAYPVCKGFAWEGLPSTGSEPKAYRAKVPGGWLIATTVEPRGNGASVHTVFVPDVYYWWELR